MTKKKKEYLNLKSELHAISSLPLEAVVERLEDVASDKILLDIQAVSPDQVNFSLRHQTHLNVVNAEAKGTLRRWQGTETRADVDSKASIVGEWLDWMLQTLQFGMLTCLYLIGSLVLYTIAAGTPESFILILLVALAVGLSYITQTNTQSGWAIFDSQRLQAFRDVDMLMQEIADLLTEDTDHAVPLLEFDGTEDALTRLLAQREVSNQAEIGTDGEFRSPSEHLSQHR